MKTGWRLAPGLPQRVVTLQPVSRHNLAAVCALDAGDDGVQVAPNLRSMAQAAVYPEAWPRAIYAGDEPVGFLMLYDPSRVVQPEQSDFYLWRLMIDHRHQNQGYGRSAVRQLVEHVRARPGAERLSVSYVAPAEALARFYAALGFAATGALVDGEVELSLPLHAAP